jgi:hypothetical protein
MTTCTCGTNQQLSMSEYGVDLEDEMLLATGGGQLCELHQPLVDLSPGLELEDTLTIPAMSLPSLALPSQTLPLTVTGCDDWLGDFLCETSLDIDQTSTSSLSSLDDEEDDFNFDCLLRTFSRDSGVSVASSCVSSSSGYPPSATLTSNTPQYPQTSGEHRDAAATSASSHQLLADLNSPISECGTALTDYTDRTRYFTTIVPWSQEHDETSSNTLLYTPHQQHQEVIWQQSSYNTPAQLALGSQWCQEDSRITELRESSVYHQSLPGIATNDYCFLNPSAYCSYVEQNIRPQVSICNSGNATTTSSTTMTPEYSLTINNWHNYEVPLKANVGCKNKQLKSSRKRTTCSYSSSSKETCDGSKRSLAASSQAADGQVAHKKQSVEGAASESDSVSEAGGGVARTHLKSFILKRIQDLGKEDILVNTKPPTPPPVSSYTTNNQHFPITGSKKAALYVLGYVSFKKRR